MIINIVFYYYLKLEGVISKNQITGFSSSSLRELSKEDLIELFCFREEHNKEVLIFPKM